MARFKPQAEAAQAPINKQLEQQAATAQKNYPFKNLYACCEGDMVYVNMEATENISRGMTTLRDIAIIVDISGSMSRYYKDGSVERMCSQIVDTVAQYDDDGIDILFFARGFVYQDVVRGASEVPALVNKALSSKGAYGSTMPTEAFRKICDQFKAKGRAGTVLFLTDGFMDDGGSELKSFYRDYLHKEFQNRDNFYCYAIEFGNQAVGALDVLDGMYKPDQGPEDLFDLESADNIDKITDVLVQVCGMSAVGSNQEVSAKVSAGAKIDMVNADLIEGGMDSIAGAMNKIMSFRVVAGQPFTLDVNVQGYDPMTISVTPQGVDADIAVK